MTTPLATGDIDTAVTGIAAALAEHEAFERWRAGQQPPVDEADTWRRKLVAAVRGDIANAAVLIATLASIANAIEGRAPTVAERAALAVFAPAHTVHFRTAVERLLASDLAIDDCWRLQSYLARLALALRLSSMLARDGASPLGREAASAGDCEIHADAWRRVCSAAVAVIECLDALLGTDVPAEGPAGPGGNGRTLALLRAASHGGTPCLDADGRVMVPGWAERRRESRLALNVVASAIVGERTLAAIIRDASPSGLGLTLSSPAKPGEAISVRLADGRALDGIVAWAVGRRAGVRLERRLQPGDLATRRQ
jgi:hypothetical protein